MLLFPASATMPLRLYLDESGTLGFGGEVFTMAMVLVSDLAKLETSIARNKTTQAEIKASQMKTPQKLELARKLLEENDLQIFLLTIDPAAAYACERKLDKELLYDSMIAQAMAYYLQRGELPRGRAYRLSLDMRGGIRESFEDMVRESIGNVLMHRDEPLVTDLQVRYMDSKYSAGVQVADLFSNIYRTTLSVKESPCNGFLHKYMQAGVVHAGFSFGLRELADQMSQIAADLRARVEYEERNHAEGTFRTLPLSADEQFEPKTTPDRVMVQGERMLDEAGRVSGGASVAVQLQDDQVAGEQEPAERSMAGTSDAARPDGAGAPAGERGEGASEASSPVPAAAVEPEAVPDAAAQEGSSEAPKTLSRSARRRRSRAARKAADAEAALAVRLAMAQGEAESDGVADGAQGVRVDEAQAAVTVDAGGEVAAEAALSLSAGAEHEAAGLAEAASDVPAGQAAPAKTRRPGWRAKAEVQAKAEKAAAKAKAGKLADNAPEPEEAQVKVEPEPTEPSVYDATTEPEGAHKPKGRRSGRSRSAAKKQAGMEKAEQQAALVEDGAVATAPAVDAVTTDASAASASVSTSSTDAASDVAVVEGASGHTARERRQMAAQKSGVKKRSRKPKADAGQPGGGQQAEPAADEGADRGVAPKSAEPGAPADQAAEPAAPGDLSGEPKTPAGKDADPAEPPAAPAEPEAPAVEPAAEAPKASRPAAKRTRTRKAKPAAAEGAPAQGFVDSAVSESVPSEPALPEATDAPGDTAPHQDDPATAPAPKPKRTRTRSRKSAAKPKDEAPATPAAE